MTTESIQQDVMRAQVAALYATAWSSTLADALLAGVVSALFYWKLGDPLVLVWAALYLLQFLRHPPMLKGYRLDRQATENSEFWARKQWQELLLHSSVWGLAPWMFMPPDNLPMTVLMILLLLGISSASVLALAPRWLSVVSMVVPMVVSLILALAWRADSTHLFLAVCSTVYLGVTLHFAYQQHRLLTSSLYMRFEKQALADQLASQVAVIQNLSEEKTRFFAAASHDLRQPLHAIALFGAVLEKSLEQRPERAHAQRLMDAVRTLGTSLDTMFDVSLLDSGAIVPVVQALPLTPIFQQLNQMFASRAEQKGLQLRMRASPLWVKSDRHLLLRIVGNLIENAIKYTPDGGVLVVARTKGEHVFIDVFDTGIGISEDQIGHIFSEFYQANNPGRDRAKGMGIGLTLVRRMATLLDHPISVHSRFGVGSRFRLRLPKVLNPATQVIQRTPAGLLPKALMQPTLGTLRRVLLLDDEKDIGDAFSVFLSAQGVELVAVRDEAEATEAFIRTSSDNGFDALIFDYRLAGGADGLDVAMGLRTRFDPQLPLLMVTGETAGERLSLAQSVGVPVLQKPVYAEALLIALGKLKRPV